MDVLDRKWRSRYITITKEISTWSKDPDTQVGAVIATTDGKPVSWGFNGVPMGVEDTEERLNRPTKYHYMAHAERNAMDFSNINNFDDCVLFITHAPCSSCATSIVNRKIKHVVVHSLGGFTNDSFINRHSSDSMECHRASLKMFGEAGIGYWECCDEGIITFKI